MSKDEKIDAYIQKSADFAKPILNHIRILIHQACPDAEEKIKWSMPHFDYKGSFCHMASFKGHCAFGFWKAALMKDAGTLKSNQGEAMGHLGRITSLKDLPSDKILKGYIKEAMRLNDEGVKLPPRKKETELKEIIVPEYFTTELSKNKAARQTFEAFSPSHKREYITWITEAKSEETRNRRIATALENMTEGKNLNWKYQKK
ncbi:MAG: YdeI/OmpD-associated family protein [Ferruginibacter sp.]